MSEETLFERAVQLPAGERAAYLDRECPDAALRARVEALLAADAANEFVPATGDFAHEGSTRSFGGAQPTGSFHSASAGAGTVVAGKYTLVEPIGDGGMGSVWRAKQTEPVKRFVAVKLIKAGMDSRQVLARFDAERQALAMMDHPNIAKVLDGGLHDGRPFFVMELVKGVPITEYCDHHKLTPKSRLELFVQACQAIQHAHQKGIIHRDIKPSNVLVALYDDRPVVKVIDFGVAKATGGTLTEATIDTGFGGVVGTPQYMSPEQATFNNLDIDTRSDVYALGVLLYELLTGSPPFSKKELEKKGLLEILRVVREEEPPRPSTKLSTADALPSLSASRSTEPKKLTGLLRNELDWIVMKALEKDRTRRYETANGFAADVQRFLSGEAVIAHPPSTAYRIKKFVRRNRGQVIAASLVLAVLLTGIAGTSIGLVRAERARADEAAQRQRADDEAAIAKAVNEFLQNDLLSQADMNAQLERDKDAEPDPDLKVRTVLDRAAATVGETFRDQPRVEAAIRQTLGNAYRSLGEVATSVEQNERAYQILKEIRGADHDDTLEAMLNLGASYNSPRKHADGMALARKAWDVSRVRHGNAHSLSLKSLKLMVDCYRSSKHFAEAIPLFEGVAVEMTATNGADQEATLTVLDLLAKLYHSGGNADKRIEIRERIRATRIRLNGFESPETLDSSFELADAYGYVHRHDEAIALAKEALSIRHRIHGPEHRLTLGGRHRVATRLALANRPDEAISIYRELIEYKRKTVGLLHNSSEFYLSQISVWFVLAGKHDEAITYAKLNLDNTEKNLGSDHPRTLSARSSLAHDLLKGGRTDEAIQLFQSVQTSYARMPNLDSRVMASLWFGLAKAYSKADRHKEALELFQKALPQYRSEHGADSDFSFECEGRELHALVKLNRSAEAIPRIDDLLKRIIAKTPRTFNQAVYIEGLLTLRGQHFGTINDGPECRATAEMYEKYARVTANGFYDVACIRAQASGAFAASGKPDEAKADAQKAIVFLNRAVESGYRDYRHMASDPDLKIFHHRDEFLALLGYLNWEFALPLYEENYQFFKGQNGPDHPETLASMDSLAIAHSNAGNRIRARALYVEVLEIRKSTLGPDHLSTLKSRVNLARIHRESGAPELACKQLEETLRLAKAKQDPESPFVSSTLTEFGLALLGQKKYVEAEPILRESLAIREKKEPDDWRTYNTQSLLGGALLGQEKYADAEPLLLQGFEGMKAREKSIPPQSKFRLPASIDKLIDFYTSTNNPDEVKRWRAERTKYREKAPPPKEKK